MLEKKEFKETPIGRIPEEWEVVRLGNICEFKRGFSYRSDQIVKNVVTKIRFITINDLEKEGGLKLTAEKIYLKEKIDVDSTFFLNEGDVLIANTDMSKGFIIGAPLLIENTKSERLVYSMDLTKLIFDKSAIFSKFLFHLLKYGTIRRKMKTFAQGTNVLHLNHDLVKSLKIPLPPLPEQRKIAEILSTVDEAIQRVDEAIARTERLKRGLMQELLTKGIGHERFKFSKELGCEIPEEWEVVRLEYASVEITDGSHYSPKEDRNGDYRIATVANIKGDGIDIDSCKKISKEDYYTLVKNGCKPQLGDVLFSKDGTVGLSFSFKQNEDLVLLSSIAIIRPKENLDSDYCAYVLKSPFVFRQIVGSKRGTGLRRIILRDIKRIRIPLPPLLEQRKIAEILSTVDKKLELEMKRKGKFERVKKGLMNNLLTGRNRVKVAV